MRELDKGTDSLCDTSKCIHHECDASHCGDTVTIVVDPETRQIGTYKCVYNCRPGPCAGGCAFGDYADSWAWVFTDCVPSNFCCSDSGCSGFDTRTKAEGGTGYKYVCDCPGGGCSLRIANDYRCYLKQTCSSNNECAPDWCCTDNPGGVTSPNTIDNKCDYKGDVEDETSKNYICTASSRAGWVECNKDNLNEIREGYVCTSEGWVAVSGGSQPSEAQKTSNFFDLLIQLFKKIFFFL